MRLDHLLSKRMSKGRMYFTVELSRIAQSFLVAIRPGETPVPIPNTTVKTRTADGTALETVWESRRPPDFNSKMPGHEDLKYISLSFNDS